jgi:hypothetical protein
MKKQTIRTKGRDFYPDDNISNLIQELQTALEYGYTHVAADYSGDYRDFVFVTERLETDEEYNKRTELEQSRWEQMKKNELAELARLKEKYEGK